MSKKIAIILVRGLVEVNQKVKDTLTMLGLKHKNHCVVREDSAVLQGMLKKVKDYITWGEVDQTTFDLLMKERAQPYLARTTDRKGKYSYNTLEVAGKHYKPYFQLNSPKKGFGRKGIKMPFKLGGALGNRAEKINDLIQRMV